MVSETGLMNQLVRVLDTLDEDSFIEIVNSYLGTEYTYDDISWDKG